MPSAVLINAETEEVVLYLDGIERGSHVYDAIVTDHPLSDGSSRTDGRVIRPRTLQLTGTVGCFTTRDGQLTGDLRAEEVVGILRTLQVAATRLSVEIPGRGHIDDMQIERFVEDIGPSPNSGIAIDLKEMRTASSYTVALQALPVVAKGSPSPEVASGQEETKERGTRPNKELTSGAATVVDTGATGLAYFSYLGGS